MGGVEKGGGRRHLGNKALVVVAAEVDGRGIGRIRMKRIPDSSAVHLHLARQLIPTWTHHSPAQFLQHHPSGLVASQSQQALQSQRTHPAFGGRHLRAYSAAKGLALTAYFSSVRPQIIGIFI